MWFANCLLFCVLVRQGLSFCPDGYSTADNQMCYSVSQLTASRDVASQRCSEDGGSMASINNGFVNSYIYSLGNQIQASHIWLGFKCSDGNGSNCVNDDATPFGPYSNFYPNNPSPISNCVYMAIKAPASQLWLTFDCTEQFAFACGIPYNKTPVRATTTTIAPTTKISNGCPTGYQPYGDTCYKYNLGSLNRDTASASCGSIQGGALASIHSSEVNQFLVHLEQQVVGTRDPYVHFGLRCPDVIYNKDTKGCVWDDKGPFNYNGFGGVNPIEDGDECIDFDSGKWENIMDCDQEGSFICQVPKNNK